MQSRNQYLKVLRERYLKAKAKKEKTQTLDKYCRNTGQVRKYDTPKTPYQRLVDSGQISEETRKQLETVYLSLNPA